MAASDPGSRPGDIRFFGEPLEAVRVRGRLRRIADGEPLIYAGDWDGDDDGPGDDARSDPIDGPTQERTPG